MMWDNPLCLRLLHTIKIDSGNVKDCPSFLPSPFPEAITILNLVFIVPECVWFCVHFTATLCLTVSVHVWMPIFHLWCYIRLLLLPVYVKGILHFAPLSIMFFLIIHADTCCVRILWWDYFNCCMAFLFQNCFTVSLSSILVKGMVSPFTFTNGTAATFLYRFFFLSILGCYSRVYMVKWSQLARVWILTSPLAGFPKKHWPPTIFSPSPEHSRPISVSNKPSTWLRSFDWVGSCWANSQMPLLAPGARPQQACGFTCNHYFAFMYHFWSMKRFIFQPGDDVIFLFIFYLSLLCVWSRRSTPKHELTVSP